MIFRRFNTAIAVTFLLMATLLAQADQAEDLILKLEGATGSERIPVLVELVDTYRTLNPQLAIEYAEEGLLLLAVDPDPRSEVDIRNEMSWAYRVLGNYPDALKTGQASLRLAQESEYPSGASRALNNLGVIYFYLGDNDRALAAWIEALGIRENLDDQEGVAGSLNNIGLVYTRQANFEDAILNFNRALEISRTNGNREYELNHLDNLGEAYAKLGDYDSAERSYLQALEIANEGEYLEGKLSVLVNLGALEVSRGALDAARQHLDTGIALAESLGGISKQAEAGLYLARLHRQQEQLRLATDTALAALARASRLGEKHLIRDLEAELAALYELQGDDAEALAHLKSFNVLQESLFDSERQNTIALLQTRFEVAESEKEIALLQAGNALQALELETARTRESYAQLLALLLTVFALVLFFTLWIRNRSRKLLAATAANYNQLLESLSLGVLAQDASGEVLFSNDAMASIVTKEPAVRDRLLQQAQSMLTAGQRIGDWQLAIHGQQPKDLLLVVEHRFDEFGAPSGLWLIVTDLTEQKATSAQLVQAAKLATLGEMSTGMAHELNQPLNIISLAATNLRMALERGKLSTESASSKIDKINAALSRAAHIIDHMRAYGLVAEEGFEAISVSAVVAEACGLTEQQLKLRNVELINHVNDEQLVVNGNAIQIEQVLFNLISNARDAVLSVGQDGRIEISAERVDQRAQIRVRDTGGGIPQEVLPRIFEPFFTTKPVGQGTGLGGSISYGIVKDMQGDIWAENVTDGAQITISLPLVSDG